MFQKTSGLYRTISRNGSLQLISKLRGTNEAIVTENAFVRYCTTARVSTKFTRGIAQTARQEDDQITFKGSNKNPSTKSQ